MQNKHINLTTDLLRNCPKCLPGLGGMLHGDCLGTLPGKAGLIILYPIGSEWLYYLVDF